MNPTTPNHDELLWQQARQRVSLRWHALTSLALIAFLTAVWYLTGPRFVFWPAWAALGMGTGLLVRAMRTYFPQVGSVEHEYQKLAQKQPE
jgi:hypothetical protein